MISQKYENDLLLKEGFQCLFFSTLIRLQLRFLLFECSFLQTAADFFPLISLFFCLALRGKRLHLDFKTFFTCFEEE